MSSAKLVAVVYPCWSTVSKDRRGRGAGGGRGRGRGRGRGGGRWWVGNNYLLSVSVFRLAVAEVDSTSSSLFTTSSFIGRYSRFRCGLFRMRRRPLMNH